MGVVFSLEINVNLWHGDISEDKIVRVEVFMSHAVIIVYQMEGLQICPILIASFLNEK